MRYMRKKVLNLLVGKYKVSIFAVPKLRRGGREEEKNYTMKSLILAQDER